MNKPLKTVCLTILIAGSGCSHLNRVARNHTKALQQAGAEDVDPAMSKFELRRINAERVAEYQMLYDGE